MLLIDLCSDCAFNFGKALIENVANSIKYTKDKYTFIDLDLGEWAKENNLDPLKIAINFKLNLYLMICLHCRIDWN
jgi:hypothetical protein